MPAATDLLEMVESFQPIDLETLDELAALRRRVDNKYVVAADRVAEALEALRGDHRALEIDGRRAFGYESVYLDTPGFDAFHAHVEDRRPRHKVRTRLYVDSGDCVLEVKVKDARGETAKEQREHDPARRERLDDDGRAFVEGVLGEPAGALAAALTTRFRRSTLAQVDGAERVTVDVDLELLRPDGARARLREPCAIVETKTR